MTFDDMIKKVEQENNIKIHSIKFLDLKSGISVDAKNKTTFDKWVKSKINEVTNEID